MDIPHKETNKIKSQMQLVSTIMLYLSSDNFALLLYLAIEQYPYRNIDVEVVEGSNYHNVMYNNYTINF